MNNEINRTLWVGNLSERVTEELLFELFLQAGPLDKVHIPKEREGGRQKSFAFVTFTHDMSIPYTIQLMDGVSLFGRPLRLQSRPGSIHQKQQNQFAGSDIRGVSNLPHVPNMTNPYSMNRPVANPLPVPEFQRSNTWHGNEHCNNVRQGERAVGQMDRDYEHRGDRSREHGHYNSRERRDRSSSRHREERGSMSDQDRDSYNNSPNTYSGEDFEPKRHNVLQRLERMTQHYRRDTKSRQFYAKYDKY